jgi:hypothetical protein
VLCDHDGQAAHESRWKIMAHAGHDLETCAPNVSGRVAAGGNAHQRIVRAVDHQRRRCDPLQ